MQRPSPSPDPHRPTDPLGAWAFDYITSTDLDHKRRTPPVDELREAHRDRSTELRLDSPGRPAELQVVTKTQRSLRPGAMQNPAQRAALLHRFWHHELQAAELMAWAMLAFPDAPSDFHRGLLGIASDEIRHMAMYEGLLRDMDCAIGSQPVRDWFWQRVPVCASPLEFVALLGIGLEGGNLDHSERFVEAFETAGDTKAAAVQRVVCEEEIAHVAFARTWFEHWSGQPIDFDHWRRTLTPPLTPVMLRGRPINREARLAAGLSEEFVDALANWMPPESPS